jgi:hypothetical protein
MYYASTITENRDKLSTNISLQGTINKEYSRLLSNGNDDELTLRRYSGE